MDIKLLQDNKYEDIKRFLVATLREIYHLLPLSSQRMIINDYSKLNIFDTLFNMSLIVDQLLEKRFPADKTKGEKANMATAIFHLALHYGWTTKSVNKDAGAFVHSIKPPLNNIQPDHTVPDLIDGNVTLNNNNTSKIQSAIFMTYHLRNFAGHNIEGSQILVSRFDEVLSMIIYALLLTIDIL